jgi:hypothetical protein
VDRPRHEGEVRGPPRDDPDADCYFRGPAELFLDVWHGRHQLGPTDFLTGKVRSNNPILLKDFVAVFRKSD